MSKNFDWLRNESEYLLDPEEDADLTFLSKSDLNNGEHPSESYYTFLESAYWQRVR